MRCDTTGRGGNDRPEGQRPWSPALSESAEDLYENAPCGYLSTLPDGQIIKVNATLLKWLGYSRDDLVGRRRFTDLLTVGGRVYHETHFAPLLRMQGELSGIALELRAADGTRRAVLVASRLKTDTDGAPLLVRTAIFDARDRRAYEQELLRARQDAVLAQQEADRERARVADLAHTLQRSLLPPTLPSIPGVGVAAHYHPASADEVGGDFYDVFAVEGNRWAFILGDVCGKGAPAAAVTSLARYTLRSATAFDPQPAEVLRNLNAVFRQQFSADPQFCTVLFGLLTADGGSRDLTLASGGHPPPLLVRADGNVDYQHLPGGQVIGILPEPHIATATLRLEPGDTVLLYTDGLTEARTDTGTGRYDEQALREFVLSLPPPTTAAALIRAISELLASFGTGVEDDVAALALGIPAG